MRRSSFVNCTLGLAANNMIGQYVTWYTALHYHPLTKRSRIGQKNITQETNEINLKIILVCAKIQRVKLFP